MKRDWDKFHRQRKANRPLTETELRQARKRKLMDWRHRHPEARNWALPASLV